MTPSTARKAISYPREVSLASTAEVISVRFEEQVAANRHRLAVSAGNTTLSYRALNEAANRIAALLLPDPGAEAIGVLIGQRASIVAVMLGVLKAGKIFVPLDPRQPPARLRRILEDCQARVLVTDGQSLNEAHALLQPGLQLINVDALDTSVDGHDTDVDVEGDALACLIYTSGSTGIPKGVMQTHRGLLHRTKVLTDLLRVTRSDRIAMLATSAVSQGVSTTLQALLNGASLHPFDLRESGFADLAAWLIDRRITVLVCSPGAFRHFARTLTTREEFPNLRVIRLGSEPVLPRDVELYRQHFGRGCTLVGTFGSTESGPVATYVMDHDSEIAESVPAGYPVDDSTVRILNETGAVCPAGEPGEIVVHSNFLFPGYWRDPDRTAAAFVPMTHAGGGHFYRTGDIGKMRPDGCLEYIGRKNLQVKIRGFRVELEEIERALCAHPCVLEAVAMVQPDKNGDQKLVAGVVSTMEPPPAADTLRAHLRSMLPEQMVPSTFQFLRALPRNANGKVCRLTLSAPDGSASPVRADNRPPSDIVESCLMRLWEELLDQPPISVTANFFEAGGHSLLAARLSTSIERAFGTHLPLSAFIAATTIEQQARLIRNHQKNAPWPSLVPIRANGSKPPLFCMHLREGDVLSYRDLARHLPSDQPLYGLQSRGLDGMSLINTRMEDMARDYVAEIRKLYPGGPYAICGWSFGGVVAFEVARQLEQEGQEVALLALLDSVVPQLASRPAPLLRREVRR